MRLESSIQAGGSSRTLVGRALRSSLIAVSLAAAFTAPALAQAHDPAQGNFLVRASGSAFPAGFSALVTALGGRVIFAHGASGVAAIANMSDDGAAQIARMAGIAAVVDDDFTSVGVPLTSAPEAATNLVQSPSDPTTAVRFARQWHLRQIEAPAAWAAGRLGKPTTKVAILDTGLGYTHPDLAGRVDLALSRSFVPDDDLLVQNFFPGAHPIADLHYHGTHVGATVSSNALAAAGVTSGVTLVGVKVCSAAGSCPTSAVLAGVLYAADVGVPVANMSLGGSFLRRQASARGGDSPSFIAIINQVFGYAHRKGTTFVVSAGNSNADLDHDGNSFKAYCSSSTVICVSATGPTAQASTDGPWTDADAKASYSNYGVSSINVAAPGGNGSSRVTAACSPFSLQLPICQTGVFVLGINGTSMAAPHASGVAALISEDVGKSPARIRARLQQTADDLGDPGADPIYGKGRINARKAVGL
jgi:lantibiotic leader peptide-processing serine protease